MRSFETAPRVRSGDTVQMLQHDDDSPGWFFGAAPGGLRGYFPVNWFDISPDETTAVARQDYDAAELTIEAGVEIDCLATEAGWLFVRTPDGQRGWIPEDCVKQGMCNEGQRGDP